MPRNLGPFSLWEHPSPCTHLWRKLLRKPESRSGQKQSRGKRSTHSQFVEGRPPSNQSVCKFLEKAEYIPLQMPAPPKAILLAPTWLLSNFALIPLIWKINYCYYNKRSITMPETSLQLLPSVCYGSAGPPLTRWLISCMSPACVICSCSVVCHLPFLSILLLKMKSRMIDD